MQRTCLATATLVAMASLTGCGSQSGGGDSAAAPADAVFEFLDAVRNGDDTTAQSMLTTAARQKTAELNMVVAPPGSDTASFEVGGSEMMQDGRVHVGSIWMDVDHEGSPIRDEIIWILRQEAEGWKIAGMQTRIFEDMAPVEMNFENPEEMIRQQQLAEQEALRRANDQHQQAMRPDGGDPFQAGPK